jgi:hypothetical protein
MKPILLILTVFAFNYGESQTISESFIACSKSFTTICENVGNNAIKVIIKDGEDDTNKVEFTITTTSFEVFAASFKQAFGRLPVPPTCNAEENNRVLSGARELFFKYKAAMTENTVAPEAGIFKVRDSVYVYQKTKKTSKFARSADPYRVLKVQVEINDGYIENIKATVLVIDKIFYFTNYYGIGFSSVTNFDRLNSVELFEMHSSPYSKIKPGESLLSIKLHHLIDYDYALELNRRDYSPQNIKFNLEGGQSITLYKQVTKKLFEAHIFTDFIGLKEEKPNGLIQTEVSKKININTVQFRSPSFLFKLFKSLGVFQYVRPSVVFSKIEQHNKRLPLKDLDSIRFSPGNIDTSKFNRSKHRYTTPLELYQYQHLSAGIDANLLSLSNHDLKYNLFLNAGIRLGITQVSDSATQIVGSTISKTGEVNERSINMIQIYPEVILNFLPEERFSLSMIQRMVYLGLFNTDVQMLGFNRPDQTTASSRKYQWLSVSEIMMTIQVNDNSKLFGRVRFNAELRNFQNNFAQVQIGYSVYILGNSVKQ